MFPVQEFPVQVFPVQVFPVQEFPVQEFPVQEFPVQEFPVHEPPVQEFPVQELPVHEPPDHVVPDSSPVTQPKALHVVRKTLCSPTTGVPSTVTWSVPRASSRDPVPRERDQRWVLVGVAASAAASTSRRPAP